MFAVRPLATRLDHLLARRAEARRRLVEPQAVAAVAALRLAGAEVELVGSLARGEFRVNSDVDFLVLARGSLSETLIFTTICDHLKTASFDLVFADQLAPASLEVMRRNAEPRA